MPELPSHGLTKDEIRNGLRQACAIAHGRGTGMSLLELGALILERGLPTPEERERIRAEKLAAGDNTTPSSSPELLNRRDTPDAASPSG